jgi:hypothetical protein
LICDKNGHLFISDANNNVIRQIDLGTGIITTTAGSGAFGFMVDGGAAGNANFSYPAGLAVDNLGNLFIADESNSRVRRVIFRPTGFGPRIGSSSTAISAGESVTLTVKNTVLSFGFAPTGTATFLNGTTSLGTATFAPVDGEPGVYAATLSTDVLPAGTASITGRYDGDMHYASVTTPAIQITVSGPAPSYTLSAAPSSLTIKQGSSGSITFSVTPKNGFNQAVSFSCDPATLPQGVSCSFNPASVAPNGSAAVTSVLTVQTAGGGSASLEIQSSPLSRWWLPAGGSTLALLLFWLPVSRRKTWQTWMGVLLLVVCIGGLTGCSAIEKAINGDDSGGNATPPGTYSISVNAGAGTGSTALLQPLTVSITVTQ